MYNCSLGAYPLIPQVSIGADASWPASAVLASTALYASGPGLSSTGYQHDSVIDGVKGTYFTDCSCFVSFMLQSSALTQHLAEIPLDMTVYPPAPRAAQYHDYFSSLSSINGSLPCSSMHWQSVPKIADAAAGDIISYTIPGSTGDTGHVMIMIPTSDLDPTPLTRYNESAWWVAVADSSSTRHENDSTYNCDGSGCHRGVGRGQILVSEDEDGAPRAFMFNAKAASRYYPIVMARPL